MIRTFKFICAILFIVSGFLSQSQTNPEITTQELEEHIYFLASDSLKGRKPGTPESRVAAEYIRDQFISFGLNPIGDDGFQYFDVITSVKPGEKNALSFNSVDLEMGKDFYPAAFAANAQHLSAVDFDGF